MKNENKENKENIILTDEELKEVAGAGILDFINSCLAISDRESCESRNFCKWDKNQNKCLNLYKF